MSNKEKVLSIINEISLDKEVKVSDDTDLFEAGVLDSFGMITFISSLEKAFDVEIANDYLVPQNLWSVNAATKMMNEILNAKQ